MAEKVLFPSTRYKVDHGVMLVSDVATAAAVETLGGEQGGWFDSPDKAQTWADAQPKAQLGATSGPAAATAAPATAEPTPTPPGPTAAMTGGQRGGKQAAQDDATARAKDDDKGSKR